MGHGSWVLSLLLVRLEKRGLERWGTRPELCSQGLYLLQLQAWHRVGAPGYSPCHPEWAHTGSSQSSRPMSHCPSTAGGHSLEDMAATSYYLARIPRVATIHP